MKHQTRWINALMIVALLMAWSGSNAVMAQTPVGAAFTYQGRLMTISGLCDISFMLYDEESGGTQIGATQTITDVVMADGYFSADPDFGAPAWNGDTRWLEVEATCPPGGSLMEFPRQVVRAVPYAMYALNSNAITSTVYVTETVYYTPTYHLQGWETITGTPESYTPTAHTQGWDTITGQPAEYTPTYHLQGWGTITGTPASYTPTAINLTSTYIGYGSAGNTLTGTANATLDNTGNIDAATINLSETSNQIIFQSKGVTGELTWTPATTAKTIILPNATGTAVLGTGASSYIPYWSGVNTLSGSANATLDASGSAYLAGNVGIGTDAPNGPLRLVSTRDNSTNWWLDSGTDFGITNVSTYASMKLGARNARITYGGGVTEDNLQIGSRYASGNAAYAFTMNYLGSVGIKTTTPNSFTLQVAGNVGPNASNTYDLGSAANYWATIHYHTLTAHSLSVFSTTVTLQDGRGVSCLDALKGIKADPTKTIKGIPHMDYATIPSAALNAAPNGDGEDGADLDMMVSLVLCAERELDAENTALDNRMSDLEKRIADLEQKAK